MDMVGFGVIGCGYFGAEFARIIDGLEDCRLVAVYGGSRGTAAKTAHELNCVEEKTLEGLLQRDDINAVVVASPNHLHKEAVLKSADFGKHVLCEKPIALHLNDCMEMLEACRKADVLLMAGHILHFFEGIETVKTKINEGAIGQPILAIAARTGWEQTDLSDGWKTKQELSGGHLFHHIHELDLLLSIMGPARSVYMDADNLAHRHLGEAYEDDVLMLNLRFENGGMGQMRYGSAFRWGEHYITINGTEGAFHIDFQRSVIEMKTKKEVERFPLHDDPEENIERVQLYEQMAGSVIHGTSTQRPPNFLQKSMKKEIRTFRDAIIKGFIPASKKFLFDGSAAFSSIASAEAAMKSSQTNAVQRIGMR